MSLKRTFANDVLRVTLKHETMKLLARDRQMLVQSLMSPPLPSERLVKAVKRYQKEILK